MADLWRYTAFVLLFLSSGVGDLHGQTGGNVPFDPSAAMHAPGWDQTLASFGERIAAEVSEDGVGGIAVGVVVDGDLVWAKGFGWSDREERIPMSPGVVSRTGSISKSVTAMVLMRLVDRGIVQLDDPVERYLPEFSAVRDIPPDAPVVTLRHLASHTAGLEREPANVEEMVSGPIELWEDRVVESLRNTAFDSVPGARYQYSNIGVVEGGGYALHGSRTVRSVHSPRHDRFVFCRRWSRTGAPPGHGVCEPAGWCH